VTFLVNRLVQATRIGACALLLVTACSKSKSTKHADAAPSSSVAATVASAAPADSAEFNSLLPFSHKPVPGDSLKPPPLVAPPNAVVGARDIRMQMLRAGTGDSPGPSDTIMVDYSMWTSDGKLAFSSFTEKQAAAFNVASLAPELRAMMGALKKGAKVVYWLPRASLVGWRPPAWPDADLVIEFELLDVNHGVITNGQGKQIDLLPGQDPDSAGPPSTATATPSGLKYVFLAHGSGKQHPTKSDRLELQLNAFAVDGLTVQQLERGLKSATTLERAPGNLGEILSQMVDGDMVRVWLPMGVGRAVIPKAGSHDVVLDMALSFAG
jgi:FKBP-type peptidyl-prolyl cis-trans isomerase